ncbi:hypothetical protein GQ457_01G022680 [Hibiscus cannabinus]
MARFEEGQSISCPPLFEGEAYFQWRNIMKSPKKKKRMSANDTKAKLNDKAMHTLHCGLNEDVSKQVSTCKSDKEIWEKLEKLYGNKKEDKKDGVSSCANLLSSSKVDSVFALDELKGGDIKDEESTTHEGVLLDNVVYEFGKNCWGFLGNKYNQEECVYEKEDEDNGNKGMFGKGRFPWHI